MEEVTQGIAFLLRLSMYTPLRVQLTLIAQQPSSWDNTQRFVGELLRVGGTRELIDSLNPKERGIVLEALLQTLRDGSL